MKEKTENYIKFCFHCYWYLLPSLEGGVRGRVCYLFYNHFLATDDIYPGGQTLNSLLTLATATQELS